MGPTRCAVPGCSQSYDKRSKRYQFEQNRSIFTVFRPDLGSSSKEKEHRKTLANCILSLRGLMDGDKIKLKLHREKVGICELHFLEEDILRFEKTSRLKVGAKPCRNLPSPLKFSLNKRKELFVNNPLSVMRKNKCIADLLNASRKFPKYLKESYVFYEKQQAFIAEIQEDDCLVPRFRVTFGMNTNIDALHVYGWKCKPEAYSHVICRSQSLKSILRKILHSKVCKGTSDISKNGIVHHVLKFQSERTFLSNFYRSSSCTLITQGDVDCCNSCCAVEALMDVEV